MLTDWDARDWLWGSELLLAGQGWISLRPANFLLQ